MSTASRNSQAATNWAQKRREQMERARAMKDDRFHGDGAADMGVAAPQAQWHDNAPLPSQVNQAHYGAAEYATQDQYPAYGNAGDHYATGGYGVHQGQSYYDYHSGAPAGQGSYYNYGSQQSGGYYDRQSQMPQQMPQQMPGYGAGYIDTGYNAMAQGPQSYAKGVHVTVNTTSQGAYGYGRGYPYDERAGIAAQPQMPPPPTQQPQSQFSMIDLKMMSPEVCKEVLLRMLEDDHSLIRSVRGHMQSFSSDQLPAIHGRAEDHFASDAAYGAGGLGQVKAGSESTLANGSRRRSGRSRSANTEPPSASPIPNAIPQNMAPNAVNMRPAANSASSISSAASAPPNLNSHPIDPRSEQAMRGKMGAAAPMDENYIPSNASQRRRQVPPADSAAGAEEDVVPQAVARVKQRSRRTQESRPMQEEPMQVMDSSGPFYPPQGKQTTKQSRANYQDESYPEQEMADPPRATQKSARAPKGSTASRSVADPNQYDQQLQNEGYQKMASEHGTLAGKRSSSMRDRPTSASNRMKEALDYGRKVQNPPAYEEEQNQDENDGGDEEEDEEGGDDGEKVECSQCGRRFNADRIAVHERVCAKVSKKQRKAFDPTKQRLEPDAIKLFKEAQKREKSKPQKNDDQPQKLPKWKKDRMAFINAIRAAKGGDSGTAEPLYQGAIDEDDGKKACPHCGRKFNENAADRHIPICAKIQSKTKPAPKAAPASQMSANTQATAGNGRNAAKPSGAVPKAAQTGRNGAPGAIRVR
eukprot:TRINITY_DN5069_c0_g1_i5.p1 TRINITY_DN5069_c0_g1~~TRINITY_DN5069_c0_g1_i5.p1  ORF type:complete len:755 (+),score=162.78 TRINITY_DN5069_c0_g1_i5:141-2405(+)